MTYRLLFTSLLVISLVTLGVMTLQAQGPSPRQTPDRNKPPASNSTTVHSQFERPAATATGALGEPGLSFRYVKTLGETGVAYLGDATHLNYPWGITAAGDTLWVAELWGLRLLNYTNSGNFVRTVGNAGSHLFGDTDVSQMADVAVDAQNNLWIAADYSKVIKADLQGKVLLQLNGNGTAGDDFRSPISVALDGAGNVYVSDGAHSWTTTDSHHRIVIFDPDGNLLATIGDRDTAGSGNTHFQGPRHITIHQNLLYVADSGNHRVQIFDITTPATPTFVATIGVAGETGADNQHLHEPSGVAVDANLIYIADTFNQRIQIFNRSNRSYVATIGGEWGVTNAQFGNPSDVAVDNAGNIFVADFVNTRVQQFNTNRQYVRTYGVTRTPYVSDGLHYNRPFGLDIGNDGSIYIAEERGGRVVKLNAEGIPQWTAGQAGLKNDWDPIDGSFSEAVDVAVGPTNRVYVADRYGRRVQIFNADGTLFHILDGSDEVNFEWVSGLDVAANGDLYVTNDVAHVLYIFDAKLNHIATIGEPGVAGDDNAHLRDPWDVAVDSSGAIFVVERSNYRVKKCTRNGASGSCIPWIGEIGVDYNDFGYFGAPHRLAIDSQGKLYVAHDWYSRVDIFTAVGAYLTSVGGAWGGQPSQFREPRGVAVAPNGDLYVADIQNHRIQQFSPGVAGWRQININGFGDLQTQSAVALAEFRGDLYVGTSTWRGAGERRIMRSHDGKQWEEVLGSAFGASYNYRVNHLIEFKEQLYAGTRNWNWDTEQEEGAAIWRSADGTTWSPVVTDGFGDPINGQIHQFAVFSDTLYAGTWSYGTHGAEIWRSSTGNSGEWTRVVDNGLGNGSNGAVMSFEVFHGVLYAAIYNTDHGAEIWRTENGVNWTKAMTGGFGDADNGGVFSLAQFHGALYAGVHNYQESDNPGAELWRCQQCDGNDWQQVPIAKGFGEVDNFAIEGLFPFGDALYAFTGNAVSGMTIWRTNDGTNWQQVGENGLGDNNNYYPYYDNSVTTWRGQLYVGTWNDANGGELWMYTEASSGQVTPGEGGGVYNQTHGISLTVPPGAITSTVDLALNLLKAPSHALLADQVGLRYFTITAADENGNPVTQFNQAYTLTLSYSDEEVLQARADEATLTCLYWDQTLNDWKSITSEPNPVANQVTCAANHLTEFALASGKSPLDYLFLPVVIR